jgi:hypothetical protein
MGGTNYNSTFTVNRLSSLRSRGLDTFVHDAAIRSGTVKAAVHDSLNPKIPNSAGKLVRESFDSDVHPESRAIAILFDHTSSMGHCPRKFQEKLANFMTTLVSKGFITDPQVLFGSIGDNTCDRGALQLGQFESGNEVDSCLENLWLVGGGGGQQTESYELAMYYMARHTDLDCYNKRGQKGYLFLIGDETPYPVIRASEVNELIGDKLQSDIRLSAKYDGWNRNSLLDSSGKPAEGDLLEELQEKFEVFFIMPEEGSYTYDKGVTNRLRALFGQNFLMLDKAENIVELICMTIGRAEGYDLKSMSDKLIDAGASSTSVRAASTALASYVPPTGAALASVSGGLIPSGGTDSVTRL